MAGKKESNVSIEQMKIGEYEINFNHADVKRAFWMKSKNGGRVMILEAAIIFRPEQELSFLETLKHLKDNGVIIVEGKQGI